MAKVILGVTISLDGFAEDINGSVGALYPDLDLLRKTVVLRESIQGYRLGCNGLERVCYGG